MSSCSKQSGGGAACTDSGSVVSILQTFDRVNLYTNESIAPYTTDLPKPSI